MQSDDQPSINQWPRWRCRNCGAIAITALTDASDIERCPDCGSEDLVEEPDRTDSDEPDIDPSEPIRRQSDDPDYNETEQQEAERPASRPRTKGHTMPAGKPQIKDIQPIKDIWWDDDGCWRQIGSRLLGPFATEGEAESQSS